MACLTLAQGFPSHRRGGRKVEGKNPLPPSETHLYKGDSRDLVEVEVNSNFISIVVVICYGVRMRRILDLRK